MRLNLGALAKGYAVDKAIDILKQNKIRNALINAGGDLKSMGQRSDQLNWRIGLQHPRNSESLLASFSISESAVATSGDYQKYFKQNGKRYHHILDPKTGYPATTGSISATVIAKNVMDADALSTAIFILGSEKASHYLIR
jgi:thiamine biosynthesis lipoprotein